MKRNSINPNILTVREAMKNGFEPDTPYFVSGVTHYRKNGFEAKLVMPEEFVIDRFESVIVETKYPIRKKYEH